MAHWEIGIVVLFALLLTGLPIAFALAFVGVVGTASVIGWSSSLSLLGQTYFDHSRSYSLSILPLFLMMGNFVVQSGIARDLYAAAYAWLARRLSSAGPRRCPCWGRLISTTAAAIRCQSCRCSW